MDKGDYYGPQRVNPGSKNQNPEIKELIEKGSEFKALKEIKFEKKLKGND